MAGLNASKKPLMAPWRPRKSCWCGLGALACGVKSAKKAFGGFWGVLKGLKPGKQQAWTPVKSYWWHLEGQEKAVYVALVRWPAGSRVPKKLLRVLEGFEGFEAWQTAGLNASYWWRLEGQEKSCWCGLSALACMVKGAKKAFGGFWKVLVGFVRVWGGFEGFEAWHTAGLNASKKLLMAPWRPRKSCWCGLGALACGVKSSKKVFGGFWKGFGKFLEGFEGFEAWQTAGLNASKKLLMAPWRLRKSCWCGLGALACGVKSAKKAFGGFWKVLVGFVRVWGGFEGFEAWQTGGLNASKKLLMAPWRPRKSCWCGLSALACGVKSAKKAFGGFWIVFGWFLKGFWWFWKVWSLANGRLERQ